MVLSYQKIIELFHPTVLHAPKEGEIDSLRTLGTMLMSVEFLNYLIFVVIVSSVLIYYSPRYGEKTVVVYVLICSLVGSLSVMACKGMFIRSLSALFHLQYTLFINRHFAFSQASASQLLKQLTASKTT